MNTKEALQKFELYSLATITDLIGITRKQVIQVDIVKLAPKVEEAFLAAALEMHSWILPWDEEHYETMKTDPTVLAACIAAGIAKLGEET